MLRDIGTNSDSAQWSEFVAIYRPAMKAYVQSRFPYLDADDVIQETFIALLGKLPHYQYDPTTKGLFRNYLIGILRHKALTTLRNLPKDILDKADGLRDMSGNVPNGESEAEQREWRHAIYEIALRQTLADTAIHERTKQVFVRVAINGEPPDAVAAAFGITRNAVDQMKSRMIQRLRSHIASLESIRDS